MYGNSATARRKEIRYNDHRSYLWLWGHAPCVWRGNVDLQFASVPLDSLQPAGCLLDPAVVITHLRRMRNGRPLAPPVVCATESGRWYLHDGNHRYEAMRIYFSGNDGASVRVAIAVPKPGYKFRYRWFATHGTYLLEPGAPPLLPAMRPFSGRTMVLVAHQDDETACAGLLQRLQDPLVVFATDGAPSDPYFWNRYGSRSRYAGVRRNEAEAALRTAGVCNWEFLTDHAPAGTEFRDQRLYRVLRQAFNVVSDLVRRYRPDTIVVPAYEGGHPDHDCCGFLGFLLRRRFGLPVWETPLYHRAESGKLVCRQFLLMNGSERKLVLSPHEMRTRDHMIATYRSQRDVADFVNGAVEQFRPQPDYDFSRPPHAGTSNYEWWRWPISAEEVCREFQCWAELPNQLPNQHHDAFAPAVPPTAAFAEAQWAGRSGDANPAS
jgi:LmbE family N-acetylglucosaminyl deacetylase